ncbi:HNH/ENDO VII family nuclease [Alkalihalobacillus sp. AL-G]|uniref:HNH/ENDO VII family nuclease n=1 Tax=Alkalihalobacillus sp. AL-G TaxID=2926399 RepID=UPI00272D12B6|nr:HNH/ENDO VII family nuclease [Alkalihalobacillus sp. AL-G]WLD93035.1 HNH/ENDO VII family nuclease [Alkalihalobacillus sp. AL-G]
MAKLITKVKDFSKGMKAARAPKAANSRPSKGTNEFRLGGPGYLQTFASKGTGETAKSVNKYWDNVIEFNGNKVYPRNDLFDPNTISSWKVKGKTVTGTNAERMASGRAPIGYDGKSINLHHLTQTQSGSITEVGQSFHQKYYSILHINTGGLPSGINRAEFDAWKKGYWINRSNDFMQ